MTWQITLPQRYHLGKDSVASSVNENARAAVWDRTVPPEKRPAVIKVVGLVHACFAGVLPNQLSPVLLDLCIAVSFSLFHLPYWESCLVKRMQINGNVYTSLHVGEAAIGWCTVEPLCSPCCSLQQTSLCLVTSLTATVSSRWSSGTDRKFQFPDFSLDWEVWGPLSSSSFHSGASPVSLTFVLQQIACVCTGACFKTHVLGFFF